MQEMQLEIAGLGIILYSPPAVAHIREGANYLREHFCEPTEVARHVMAGQLTGFCTGSPGAYQLRFWEGAAEPAAEVAADFMIRLGLQVQEGLVSVRDLYDLMEWCRDCPEAQKLSVSDGWYRLTVLTSVPESGWIGDEQRIDIYLEPRNEAPPLLWSGVPQLCE